MKGIIIAMILATASVDVSEAPVTMTENPDGTVTVPADVSCVSTATDVICYY